MLRIVGDIYKSPTVETSASVCELHQDRQDASIATMPFIPFHSGTPSPEVENPLQPFCTKFVATRKEPSRRTAPICTVSSVFHPAHVQLSPSQLCQSTPRTSRRKHTRHQSRAWLRRVPFGKKAIKLDLPGEYEQAQGSSPVRK